MMRYMNACFFLGNNYVQTYLGGRGGGDCKVDMVTLIVRKTMRL